MEENKIFKRKNVDPCPNKLFIAWVEEMKKNAKKNKQKSFFSYKKALNSIKRYPLILNSGKECMILDGFGKGICEMLDKKLHELAKSQDLSVTKALIKANKEYSNSKTTKDIVPDKNSANYALLFGLNEIQANNNDMDYVGSVKKEIVKNSLKYFISNDIEALWRGMAKLVKSDLVLLDGIKYRLSSNGKALYLKLYEQSLDVHNPGTNPLHNNSDPVLNKEIYKSDNLDEFQFYYCKFLAPNIEDFVKYKKEAAFKMINDKKYFRIKVNADYLISCSFDYLYDLDILFEKENFVFVFISDCDAPESSCFINEESVSKLTAQPLIQESSKLFDKLTQKSIKRTEHVECVEPPSKIQKFQDIAEKALSNMENQQIQLKKNMLYQMIPNSFEVILIVDNRENFGKGKLKEHLCPDLIKKGIKLETRPLPIGDFLWIARDEIGREAVLDFIVERKTYDDLSKSIMDGRFKEQKFRMKRSGISRIMYVLEKCKGMKNLALPMETLHQAFVNSQVNANCDIKITENGADTIDYIHLLTKKLYKYYVNKSLNVYQDCMPKDKKCFVEDISEFSAIDYASFAEASQKTKPICISEMFAKHVNCLSGITAERARALVDIYPTPRLLIEAYSKCESEKDQQSLLMKLKLISEKSFGLKHSKIIYSAYSRI